MGEILQALESTGSGDNSEEALQNALEHWNRSISQYFGIAPRDLPVFFLRVASLCCCTPVYQFIAFLSSI